LSTKFVVRDFYRIVSSCPSNSFVPEDIKNLLKCILWLAHRRLEMVLSIMFWFKDNHFVSLLSLPIAFFLYIYIYRISYYTYDKFCIMKNKYIMYKLVPVICDGQHFTHIWRKKNLHYRTISLRSEGGGVGSRNKFKPITFYIEVPVPS
jgi:hypothetical protein